MGLIAIWDMGASCGRIEMVCSQEAMGDCVGSCEWVGNRV